jgi:hypothetical protein
MRRAEHKLEDVERQLADLNDRLSDARKEWSARLREAAEETIGEHVPDLSANADSWDLDKNEIRRELRHMSGK